MAAEWPAGELEFSVHADNGYRDSGDDCRRAVRADGGERAVRRADRSVSVRADDAQALIRDREDTLVSAAREILRLSKRQRA
jgi:hypothetical protein